MKAQVLECGRVVGGVVPFVQTLAILLWFSTVTGLAAVGVTVAHRWRIKDAPDVFLSPFEIALVCGVAASAFAAVALTLSAFINVTSLVFNLFFIGNGIGILGAHYTYMSALLKANPHPTKRVRRIRKLLLRLSAVPPLLASCTDVCLGYLTDEVHYGDTSETTATALSVANLVDVILWSSTCVGYLVVVIVARRGLRERLRDLVDAKPLVGSARAVSGSVLGGLEDTASERHYTSAVDKRLVESLNGAIWTLTVVKWGAASFMLTATFSGLTGVIFGYPPWTFFLELFCNFAGRPVMHDSAKGHQRRA
ncbi:hypothetical protein HK101_005838 [Irineochytrium annulatum]|nr:hypothetical protein HK101_005838 [Irineochytrium annulatum]